MARSESLRGNCTNFSASVKVDTETSGPTGGPAPKAGGAPGGKSDGLWACSRQDAAAASAAKEESVKNSLRDLDIVWTPDSDSELQTSDFGPETPDSDLRIQNLDFGPQARHSGHSTLGRSSTFFVVIVTCTAGRFCRGYGSVYASTVIVPGVRVDCTITCPSPLNRLRLGSLSDS